MLAPKWSYVIGQLNWNLIGGCLSTVYPGLLPMIWPLQYVFYEVHAESSIIELLVRRTLLLQYNHSTP